MRWNGAGAARRRSSDHEVGADQDRARDGETVSKTHPTLADLKRSVVMALVVRAVTLIGEPVAADRARVEALRVGLLTGDPGVSSLRHPSWSRRRPPARPAWTTSGSRSRTAPARAPSRPRRRGTA